jgi:hypothetical protein
MKLQDLCKVNISKIALVKGEKFDKEELKGDFRESSYWDTSYSISFIGDTLDIMDQINYNKGPLLDYREVENSFKNIRVVLPKSSGRIFHLDIPIQGESIRLPFSLNRIYPAINKCTLINGVIQEECSFLPTADSENSINLVLKDSDEYKNFLKDYVDKTSYSYLKTKDLVVGKTYSIEGRDSKVLYLGSLYRIKFYDFLSDYKTSDFKLTKVFLLEESPLENLSLKDYLLECKKKGKLYYDFSRELIFKTSVKLREELPSLDTSYLAIFKKVSPWINEFISPSKGYSSSLYFKSREEAGIFKKPHIAGIKDSSFTHYSYGPSPQSLFQETFLNSYKKYICKKTIINQD